MDQLREAGLDACEDPAFLEIPEWVELQKRVAPLQLIPDYPMRGSRDSIKRICRGMGGIYNIHPDSAGSIIDAVILAGRIRELGAGLMGRRRQLSRAVGLHLAAVGLRAGRSLGRGYREAEGI